MPTLRRPTFRRNQRGLAAWRGRCKRHSAQTRIHDASGRIIALHFLQKPADPQSAAHIFYLHNAQGQRIFKSTAQAHNKDPYNLIPSGNGWNDFWNRFANWWRKILHVQPLPQGLQGTAFVYDEAGNLLGEYSSTEPAQDTEYIWLPTQSGRSLPVALIQGGQTYAIHSDHLGTPRIITNAQAQVVWQWEYSGFGETSPQTTAHAPNGFQFKLRFPWQYADAESGLFYNWHRSYDPNTGRYTQPDPIGLGGGWNRFAYVDNNAIWASDPMGLTQTDIDNAFNLARTLLPPGSKIPNSVRTWRQKGKGGKTNFWSSDIFVDSKYLDCLDDGEAGALLGAILHEMTHFNQSLPGFAADNIRERVTGGNSSRAQDAADAMLWSNYQAVSNYLKNRHLGAQTCSCRK